MSVAGIICEYNPFHEGHKYHIQKVKEMTGADTVAAVMSGDFVQRGGPAAADKYTRAEMALLEGADLVFELPVRYAVSSAEDFAWGGIAALKSLSFVDYYCFGCESGDIEELKRAGHFFASEEQPEYQARLAGELRSGLPYPAARERAYQETCPEGSPQELSAAHTLLSSPNNILAIEYIKAAEQMGSRMEPVAVRRQGMGYHESGNCEDEYLSATAVRANMRSGDFSGIPTAAKEVLQKAHCFLEAEDFWQMCVYALFICRDRLETVKDISPELANRFRDCLYETVSFHDFINRCKTRNITMSRIRRCVFQTLLGVGKMPERERKLPYIRLLGMRRGAERYLKQVCETVILSRLARDRKRLEGEALQKLDQDIFASDIYRSTMISVSGAYAPDEFKRPLIIIQR